jgi:hypothetical protein
MGRGCPIDLPDAWRYSHGATFPASPADLVVGHDGILAMFLRAVLRRWNIASDAGCSCASLNPAKVSGPGGATSLMTAVKLRHKFELF